MADQGYAERDVADVAQRLVAEVDQMLRDLECRPRIEQMIRIWRAEWAEQCTRRDAFLAGRRSHAEKARSDPELLDRTHGPPFPGWQFEYFPDLSGGEFPPSGVSAWTPPELCWANADVPDDDEELPLPVPVRRGTSLAEKYAAFAALYDYVHKGMHPLDPWAARPDDPDGWIYHRLIEDVGTIEPDEERELWSWFHEIRADCAANQNQPSKRPVVGAPKQDPAEVAKNTAGVPWEDALKRAEAHIARNPFPGVRSLARIVGCSPSTMKKAIDRSRKLRSAFAKHKERRSEVATTGMTDNVTRRTSQSREDDPAEAASTEELFQRLLAQATPSERERLNSMTPDERLRLISLIEDDPDASHRARGRSR